MTYTSGSPYPPGSPQAKLANKNWRWLNSWWIFAPIIGCGFFGFIGFLVAAIRTGKRHYWIATAVYASVGALAFALIIIAGEEGTQKYDTLSGIAVIPFLIAFIGPIIHAAIKNKDYLTTIANKGQWYIQPQAPAVPMSPSSFMGVNNSDYFAPGQAATPPAPGYQQPQPLAPHPPAPHPPAPQPATPPAPAPSARAATPSHSTTSAAGAPDINQARQSELAAALGIDDALAGQVIAARRAHGRFDNLDDLAHKANLQPHQLIRFRNKVTFGRPNAGPSDGPHNPPTGSTGRILDF